MDVAVTFLVAATTCASTLYGLYKFSTATIEEQVGSDLEKVKNKFSSQPEETWATVSLAAQTLVQRGTVVPVALLLVSVPETKGNAEAFARALQEFFLEILLMKPEEVTKSVRRPAQTSAFALQIINALEQNKVAIVFDIQDLEAEEIAAFLELDASAPPTAAGAIILTMCCPVACDCCTSYDCSAYCTASKFFLDIWGRKLGKDRVHLLIERLVTYPLHVMKAAGDSDSIGPESCFQALNQNVAQIVSGTGLSVIPE